MARHTFATTITPENSIRLENVSAMMGHTNIKQTQHYAKVLDVNIMKDMNKLTKKLKKRGLSMSFLSFKTRGSEFISLSLVLKLNL